MSKLTIEKHFESNELLIKAKFTSLEPTKSVPYFFLGHSVVPVTTCF